jgi:electron transfer flavoprotein alpha subunit
METILILAYTDESGSLEKAALEAIRAGKSLAEALGGAKICLGIWGQGIQRGADQVASCGAEKILAVDGPDFASSRYSSDAAAAEALCRTSSATIVIAAGTSRAHRVLPGVAQRLGGRSDTHVTAVGAQGVKPTVNRWYYRQRMESVLTRAQRPWIVLVEPGAFPAWSGEAGTAQVETVTVQAPESRTKVLGVESPAGGEQTIRPDAELLFVAGAGWTKKQPDGQPHVDVAEKLILGFLRSSGASLGSSKSLVDLSTEGQAVLGFMTHMNQIGQTGATPRHPKGLATCCHGEEPHVVGWRFVNQRRAVNLDASCGWARGKADVLYVADAFAVMTKVNELLSMR